MKKRKVTHQKEPEIVKESVVPSEPVEEEKSPDPVNEPVKEADNSGSIAKEVIPTEIIPSKERLKPELVPEYINMIWVFEKVAMFDNKQAAREPQNFKAGKMFVADAFVSNLMKIHGNNLTVEGFVCSEKTSNKYYVSRVTFKSKENIETTCTCVARNHKHRICKHVTALLLSLIIFREQPKECPKWCQRSLGPKGKSICSDPNHSMYKRLGLHRVWPFPIEQLTTEPIRNDGKKPKIILEPEKIKGLGKTYCYCNTTNFHFKESSSYVTCTAKKDKRNPRCFKKYHLECLKSKKITCTKKSEFICDFCK